jgi:meiosis arrest female protein 1
VYNQLGLGIGGSQISMSMGVDTTTLKKEIASLLRGVPNFTLPLFKFREMFANRYRRSITSSDLYKLGDVVIISGGFPRNKASPASSNGRTITLRSEWQIDDEEIIDIYCPAHPPQMRGSSSHLGWAEKEVGALLPNVIVELASFSRNILSLIESHGGGFPLLSFLDCYESEFPPLQKVLDPQGVPLEHIISCIPGVEICTGENGMKRAQLVKGPVSSTIIQPMGPQLMQLSKELVDLLKTFPKCSVPFAKLIPAYHHHFGKQCKVSDYGHYSLFSLLQNMASTVQVLGDTNNRIITLCHRAQMKRFATDVLRVLKSANGTKKQVELAEFPNAYEQLFSKPFAPEDYGLCFLSDLVKELIENSCLVALTKDESSKLYLSIPRREQTAAELQNMRAFALEVVELLRHSVRCEIPFSRFIPSYHHHFGSQCRVSNFGFSKLVELLEAIPEIVEIVEPNKESGHVERFVRLTTKEQLKVIGTQIWNLVHKRDEAGIQTYLYELEELFANEHGYSLRTELCGANGIRDLCSKLSQYLQVERDEIKLADKIPTGNADEGLAGHVSHPSGFRHHHSSRPYGFKNKSRLQLKNSASAPGSPNNLSYIAQWDHRQRIHLPPLTILSPSLSSPSFSPAPDDMNIFSFDGIVQAPMSPPFYDTLGRDVSSPCLSPQFVWTYPVPYYPPPTPPSVMMPAFPFNGPWANSSPPSMLSGPCFEQFPQN